MDCFTSILLMRDALRNLYVWLLVYIFILGGLTLGFVGPPDIILKALAFQNLHISIYVALLVQARMLFI